MCLNEVHCMIAEAEKLGAGSSISISWSPTDTPLQPCVAVATDSIAAQLLQKLITMDDAALAAYKGVAGKNIVLISGDSLPWVNGIRYLGSDPQAPNLFVPTNLQCNIPLALLDKAIKRQVANTPVALLPELNAMVSFQQALSVCRDLVSDWLEGAK